MAPGSCLTLTTLLSLVAKISIEGTNLAYVVIVYQVSTDDDVAILGQFWHQMSRDNRQIIQTHSVRTQAFHSFMKRVTGLNALVVLNDLRDVEDLSTAWLERSHWLLPNESMALFKNNSFRLNNKAMFYSIQQDEVVLEEVYSILKSSDLIRRTLGQFNASSPLVLHIPNIWIRRRNLQKATVISAALNFQRMHYQVKGGNDTDQHQNVGFFTVLMDTLAEDLNFTLKYVEPPEKLWGGRNPQTNEWTGTIGMIVRGEADIGTAGLTVTVQRLRAIDFSVSVLEDPITFVMLGFQDHSLNLRAYIDTMTWKAFTGVTIVASISGLSIFILGKFSRTDSDAFGVLNILALTGRAFLQMDCYIDRSQLATKIAWFSLAMFSYLVFVHYDATLTTQMTVSSPTPLISTFQEALDLDFKIVTAEGSVYHEFLEKALPGTPERIVYEHMLRSADDTILPDTRIKNLLQILRETPRSAYFGTSLVALGMSEFVTPRKAIMQSHLAIGMQKDSELKEFLNYHIIKLKNTGVLQRLFHKHALNGKPEDIYRVKDVPSVSALPLGYDQLVFPFSAVIGGVGISLCLLIIESCPWVSSKVIAVPKPKLLEKQTKQMKSTS